MAYYEMTSEESLVIDFEPPTGIDYWNLTPQPFGTKPSVSNGPGQPHLSEVETRADGTVRPVLAREDPGHPNWIKTFAHDRGFLIFRMPACSSTGCRGFKKVSTARLRVPLSLSRHTFAEPGPGPAQ